MEGGVGPSGRAGHGTGSLCRGPTTRSAMRVQSMQPVGCAFVVVGVLGLACAQPNRYVAPVAGEHAEGGPGKGAPGAGGDDSGVADPGGTAPSDGPGVTTKP